MGYFWITHKIAKRARVSTSEASTRPRSLARNFGEGCSHSLAAAENLRGPARARSLAQISEFFRTLLPAEVQTKIISDGGEALVFLEKFGNLKTAVRLQIFEPFLFTKNFGLDSLSWKIHFEKGSTF